MIAEFKVQLCSKGRYRNFKCCELDRASLNLIEAHDLMKLHNVDDMKFNLPASKGGEDVTHAMLFKILRAMEKEKGLTDKALINRIIINGGFTEYIGKLEN